MAVASHKGLIERKNDLITRSEEIIKEASTNKRELTDAEAKELAEIRDDVRKIKAALEIDAELHEEKTELKKEAGEDMAEAQALKAAACQEEADRRAFDAYIRGIKLNERDAVNMTKSANGAVIPTTIANKIIAMVYNICPILERSTKYNV